MHQKLRDEIGQGVHESIAGARYLDLQRKARQSGWPTDELDASSNNAFVSAMTPES